jgi:hypothetical protein
MDSKSTSPGASGSPTNEDGDHYTDDPIPELPEDEGVDPGPPTAFGPPTFHITDADDPRSPASPTFTRPRFAVTDSDGPPPSSLRPTFNLTGLQGGNGGPRRPTFHLPGAGSANGGRSPTWRQSKRPSMWRRTTPRGESNRSIQESLRSAKMRLEQETLLGPHEQADERGCYPPRQKHELRTPNPHKHLPIYTTIHRMRRIVVASVGT